MNNSTVTVLPTYNTVNSTINSTESMEELNTRYVGTLSYLVVFLGILGPVGVLGNVVVIVVYGVSNTYKNNNFKIFVLLLAAFDLLSCLTIIPVEIASLTMIYSFKNKYLCKFKCFFQVLFNSVTSLALLVIAIERYRKICRPLQRQINRGLAKKIVIFVILFAVILCAPAPIMCGISRKSKVNKYETTTEVMMCAVEKGYETAVTRMVYKSTFTVLLFVTSVTIIVLYGLILRTTCIVRKRYISHKRTCESVKLSNELLNKITDTNRSTPSLCASENIPLTCFDANTPTKYIDEHTALTKTGDEIPRNDANTPTKYIDGHATLRYTGDEMTRIGANYLVGEPNNTHVSNANGLDSENVPVPDNSRENLEIADTTKQQNDTTLVLHKKEITTHNHIAGGSTKTSNGVCKKRKNEANKTNKTTTIERGGDKSSTRSNIKTYLSDCGMSSKTLIWLILTVVFIVTYYLYTILAYYTTTQYRMSPTQLTFYKFLMRIYLINNVINPVIYALLDERFRTSCRDILRSLKARVCSWWT